LRKPAVRTNLQGGPTVDVAVRAKSTENAPRHAMFRKLQLARGDSPVQAPGSVDTRPRPGVSRRRGEGREKIPSDLAGGETRPGLLSELSQGTCRANWFFRVGRAHRSSRANWATRRMGSGRYLQVRRPGRMGTSNGALRRHSNYWIANERGSPARSVATPAPVAMEHRGLQMPEPGLLLGVGP
jgi:hypothetical protein